MTVFLSLLTIIAQIIIVVLLWAFFTGERRIGDFVSVRAPLLAFLAVLGAISGSLYYSNILGFEPCSLCLYQRYIMFLMVFILGMGLWKKYHVKNHIIVLSVMSASIGIYQYYGQTFNNSVLPCAAAQASCAKLFFIEFGYITIPLMALTAAVLVGVLMLFQKKV
ncbi:MAG: disulfide bond formation protein B [bacterium]|nr:disulfide bond formation protein B [bacterium]